MVQLLRVFFSLLFLKITDDIGLCFICQLYLFCINIIVPSEKFYNIKYEMITYLFFETLTSKINI